MYKLGSCLKISPARWNESVTAYLLANSNLNNYMKFFASLWVSGPIFDRIGSQAGIPLWVTIVSSPL